MGFLAELLLGKGTLKPDVRARLESEGLVLVEEGLPGSIRYRNFRAPGRYHNGKITAQRFAIGISRERLYVYCRSGRSKVIDSPFGDPRLKAIDISVDDGEAVALNIDFDHGMVPKVSGQMTIRAKTPNARRIVGELSARMPD